MKLITKRKLDQHPLLMSIVISIYMIPIIGIILDICFNFGTWFDVIKSILLWVIVVGGLILLIVYLLSEAL